MSDISSLNLDVELESKNTFEALPKGEYVAIITESDLKDNKSSVGKHVSATFEIVDGEMQGRMVWTNWNVQNSNQTAEKIGRAELAACCKAIGIVNPQTTEDLHDKPMIIRVDIDKKDSSRNVIKCYAPADRPTEPPVVAEKTAAVPATAKPAASGKRPWQK